MLATGAELHHTWPMGCSEILKIVEDKSSSYGPRTFVNARSAHLTVAFAENFSTKGEILTHKAAGDNYLSLPLRGDWIAGARELYRAMRSAPGRVLNVAGNGLSTLVKYGWSQAQVNAWVYASLAKVHEHLPFERIVCGGQTGVDLAGAIAGVALGIETVVTMPKGCRQRDCDGIDRTYSPADIEAQIVTGVAAHDLRSLLEGRN